MSQVETFPAPDLAPPPPPTKWERERQAFFRLLPQLLQTHRGKYVAVNDEQVVATGDAVIPVALCTYAKFGYQAIYVGLVAEEPRRVERFPA
jgi:hypothetical protein